jgi:site-specific DNA-cytosine methylase
VRYLSVCSGIEAASVAWHPLGWQPAAFSEIEPFPSAVLAHHYPTVPNLGDMTKFQEWPDEPVELLVGGTPCQSFSVAGLRKGLEDPRGNLMLTYLAIAQRYRPRWLVWENVPGVLSSNGGRDFGTFLGALGELGYGWAYRVLDAQWFGVAQRRRRVFVVGHLGDWQRAAAVLFERESVRRDTPPSREARQGAAASVAQCFAGSRQSDVAATLETTAHDYSRADGFNMVAHTLRGVGFDAGEDGTGRGTPLVPVVFKVRGGVEREDGSRGSTNIGKQAGKGYLGSEERAFTLAAAQDQFVAQPIPIHDQATRHAGKRGKHSDGKGNGLGIGQPGDPAPTLTKGDKHAVAQPVAFTRCDNGQDAQVDVTPTMRCGSNYSAHLAVAQPVYGTDCYNGAITGDVAATLGTPGSSVNASGPTVMQPVATVTDMRGLGDGHVAPTLRAKETANDFTPMLMQPVAPALTASNDPSRSPQSSEVTQQVAVVHATVMQVRRLTPVECERLQGFPDGYTNIPWRKKPEAPDGPRYKALGNSMAVPCMAWIGQRIAEVDRGD